MISYFPVVNNLIMKYITQKAILEKAEKNKKIIIIM